MDRLAYLKTIQLPKKCNLIINFLEIKNELQRHKIKNWQFSQATVSDIKIYLKKLQPPQ